jgi:Family of unknown function (DUF6364)
MSAKVTLEIPEQLFERAQRVAQDQQKDVSDVVAQVLDNGLPPVETGSRSANKEREIATFHELHPMLWSKYPGEYAAIHNGQLVDHDSDRVALLDRITKIFPEDFVLVRPIREEPEIIYQTRSVRWAD